LLLLVLSGMTPFSKRWSLHQSQSGSGWSEPRKKGRTLTNLYNERPQWLLDIHARLDAAVLVAYGWPADMAAHDLLGQLLALNLVREAAE
jgi:hypothetical protein